MKKIAIIFFIFVSICSRAATYYVSTTGNDSNTGTISSPFATWQKLASVMVAGDQAYIRGGTYRSTMGASATVCPSFLPLARNPTGPASPPSAPAP